MAMGISISLPAQETPVTSVTVHDPAVILPSNRGDTWVPTWTASGAVFTPSNDSKGFHDAGSGNVMFNLITGDSPDKLTGQTVNLMPDYGKENMVGPDQCSWKSSGAMALDGALYWVVARHNYGESSGDPKHRQTAQNASIIKSVDGGKTWTRSEKENYGQPMFPGKRFATPYFVNYGQEGHEAVADGSDKYVYALANNGFWDNGDDMVIGRCLRAKIGDLNSQDWEYLTATDGAVDANWNKTMLFAAPILKNPGHLGMTGATYLPRQKCYFMVSWFYPAGSGKLPMSFTTTTWNFYTAPHPWGPWTMLKDTHTFNPQGYYCPEICSKFSATDGSSLWAFTAGNWNSSNFYSLTLVRLDLK